MKVHLTKKMVGKMEGMRSINTSPLANQFCKKMSQTNTVCRHCYSIRLEKLYGAVKENGRSGKVTAWVKNGKVLSKRILKDSEITHYKSTRPIRFHAHGELINKTHLFNFIQIAEANPHVVFGLWTKRLDIVKGNLKQLDNLFFVYSVPKLNRLHQKLPTGFHKVFTVLTIPFMEEHNLSHLVNCEGKCAKCMICYTKNKVTHIYELLK